MDAGRKVIIGQGVDDGGVLAVGADDADRTFRSGRLLGMAFHHWPSRRAWNAANPTGFDP